MTRVSGTFFELLVPYEKVRKPFPLQKNPEQDDHRLIVFLIDSLVEMRCRLAAIRDEHRDDDPLGAGCCCSFGLATKRWPVSTPG